MDRREFLKTFGAIAAVAPEMSRIGSSPEHDDSRQSSSSVNFSPLPHYDIVLIGLRWRGYRDDERHRQSRLWHSSDCRARHGQTYMVADRTSLRRLLLDTAGGWHRGHNRGRSMERCGRSNRRHSTAYRTAPHSHHRDRPRQRRGLRFAYRAAICARQAGALTLAFATLPLAYERPDTESLASAGVSMLQRGVHNLVTYDHRIADRCIPTPVASHRSITTQPSTASVSLEYRGLSPAGTVLWQLTSRTSSRCLVSYLTMSTPPQLPLRSHRS